MANVSDRAYESLNDRQQALVDELAKDKVDGLDRSNDEIGQAVAERTDSDPYHETTVSDYRGKFADIIDERADAILNDHATVERGNVSVEGEVDISDPEQYPKPQTFDERPVKTTQDENVEPRVSVDMSLDTAYGVLASPDIPERHRKKVFEAVVEL